MNYEIRGVNSARLDAVIRYSSGSILDVGCGSGAYVLQLADRYDIKGIDYREFETWKEKPNLFSISDATNLNLPDNSVDTILSFECLEHLPNPELALKEYYRVARNNVILTVPNCAITPGMRQSLMLYYHWIDRTHVNFFTMESITELVQNSGFAISQSYYINQISWKPLLLEAFDFSGIIGRTILKYLLPRQKSNYYITCLIVAEKKNV
jgi:ubiquinone/menaquinone biosynthesis C-methylase UbiE